MLETIFYGTGFGRDRLSPARMAYLALVWVVIPTWLVVRFYTMLLGLNRARYLMLMGQVLQAREAKELGLVAELMPREKLLPRAWEIAAQLARKPDMLLRYTRAVLTHPLRKALEDGMPYYLAMETLSTLTKRGN